MNRILARIANVEALIPTLPQEQVQALKDLKFEADEIHVFQNLKSQAFCEGKFTQEEATTIYEYLGRESGTPDHLNAQTPAVRYVMNLIFSELLKAKIKK